MADASGRLRGALVAGLTAAALALGGCGAPASSTPAGSLPGPRGELVLEFDEGLAAEGTALDRVQGSGSADLRIQVRTAAGGALERVGARSGYAVRTPAATWRTPTPTAVIVVRPKGEDQLVPGTGAVRWGADLKADVEVADSASDDGSNVLQRGLFADTAQLKLQLDRRVPSCRVAGDEGDALVRADRPIPAQQWHRVQCQLRNGRLSLHVGRPGQPAPQVWEVDAEVGEIDFPRSTPVAIGGKVNGKGLIVKSSTDQFNGALDNVFLDVS